jgi:hypothetical protein
MSFSTPHHRSTLSPSGAFLVRYARVRRSCHSLRSVSWLGCSSLAEVVSEDLRMVSWLGCSSRPYCGSVWGFQICFGLNHSETRFGCLFAKVRS